MTDFAVTHCTCGLRAGDRLRLKRNVVVRYTRGRPTGAVHRAGEVWSVLAGSRDTIQASFDSSRRTGSCIYWDDNPQFLDPFERV